MGEHKLVRIYTATPSRLAEKTTEICAFIACKGDLPLHPFQAYPLELFEANPIHHATLEDSQKIRREVMELCLEDVRRSHRFGLFGISDGTLTEAAEALAHDKPIDLYPEFDPVWDSEAKKLATENALHAQTLRRLQIII